MRGPCNVKPSIDESPALLQMVDRMPAFPVSVQRVIEMTSDLHCDPRELIQVLEHDPVLTIKILKIANSAYFGVMSQISSIRHAVAYLGLNTVKHIAVTVASVGVMPRTNAAGIRMERFLSHSLSVAVLAKSLAIQCSASPAHVQSCFVAGLLHDIGQVVWAQSRPEEYAQVVQHKASTGLSTAEAETEILGSTHAQLGGMLARKWQFSEALIESIQHHHEAATDPSSGILRDCLYVANITADQLHELDELPHVQPKGSTPLTDRLCARFGGESLAILRQMPNLKDDLERARAFMQV